MTESRSIARKRWLGRLAVAGLITGAAAVGAATLPAAAYASEIGNVTVGYSGNNPWSTWGTAWNYCQQQTSNQTHSIKIDHTYSGGVQWNCYNTTNGT